MAAINTGEVVDTLVDPRSTGVMRVGRFAGEVLIEACQAELQDPERVAWRDAHSTYINKRGLTIVQNHDVYALKLSRGDQSRLDRIPNLAQLYSYMHRYIRHLGRVLPGLAGWTPDELSLHRYDDAEVGLSFHKDNLRFTRLIGILSLEGECTLAVRRDGAEQAFDAEPGDLMLLRGPGLVDSAEDLRPEHAVVALRTPTRTSMMLRENSRPDERIPGFEFDNW